MIEQCLKIALEISAAFAACGFCFFLGSLFVKGGIDWWNS